MAIQYRQLENFAKYLAATAAEFTVANPLLQPGEVGIETDTDLVKIGKGKSWNETHYVGGGSAGAGLASQATLQEATAILGTILTSEILAANQINSGFWGI